MFFEIQCSVQLFQTQDFRGLSDMKMFVPFFIYLLNVYSAFFVTAFDIRTFEVGCAIVTTPYLI